VTQCTVWITLNSCTIFWFSLNRKNGLCTSFTPCLSCRLVCLHLRDPWIEIAQWGYFFKFFNQNFWSGACYSNQQFRCIPVNHKDWTTICFSVGTNRTNRNRTYNTFYHRQLGKLWNRDHHGYNYQSGWTLSRSVWNDHYNNNCVS